MKKSVLRILSFLLVLILVLATVNQIYQFKHQDGEYNIKTFYQQDSEQIDLLVLGSSHAYNHFDTATLWEDYGISAYDLCSSAQPIWHSYYYLEEALKTTTPKLIVLEGYYLCYNEDTGVSEELAQEQADIATTRSNLGLKWSKTRLDDLEASTPKDRWSKFLLPYTQYHTRYTELTRADYAELYGDWPFDENWKGSMLNCFETDQYQTPENSQAGDRVALDERTETYYRKILQLAKDNNIPICVVTTPYPGYAYMTQCYMNQAADIAAEYGDTLIDTNLNLAEIGLDYTTDVADEGHLNYRGARKFSEWIGAYLQETYNLPNHSGDSAYSSWDKNAAQLNEKCRNYELKCTEDTASYLKKLSNKNYRLLITTTGGDGKDALWQTLNSGLGMDADANGGAWYLDQSDGTVLNCENDSQTIESDSHILRVGRTLNGDTYTNSICVDAEEQDVTADATILVYDKKMDSIVETVTLSAADPTVILRAE